MKTEILGYKVLSTNERYLNEKYALEHDKCFPSLREAKSEAKWYGDGIIYRILLDDYARNTGEYVAQEISMYDGTRKKFLKGSYVKLGIITY